jgi:hypothetical protein
MERFYSEYHNWEDWKNGLYSDDPKLGRFNMVKLSYELLTDVPRFYDVMKKMSSDWVVSTKVNLTNINQNRRAWLGAVSCNYNHSCNESLVRLAWSLIDFTDQEKANKIADQFIIEYERENFGLHINMGEKMLF